MIDVVEEVVEKNDPNAGKKKKKTPSAMWTMMKDKALDTGVQGVPNIGRAKNKVRKFFWILVVIGGTRECSVFCVLALGAATSYQIHHSLAAAY